MEQIRPGAHFADLEIGRELGRGGAGRVYQASDLVLGRQVALKVLAAAAGPLPAEERERMLQEARVVARMRGPHIVTLFRVHSVGEIGLALEMEYMEGGSLSHLLGASRRLDPEFATSILRGILSGLDEAHSRGIVHGDVKPGNVLLTAGHEVKLADFGLSRLVGDITMHAAEKLEVAGTPLFMAPEVIMGEPASVASDLWSTGTILYRMMAGRLPFGGSNLAAVFYGIQNAQPPPLEAGLPEVLANLALRCLAKDPAQRPQSCAEALDALTPSVVAEVRPGRGVPLPEAPRLFGREIERTRLFEEARAVIEGHGRTVLISGAVGSGKKAVARDLRTASSDLGYRWIQVRVSAFQGLLHPLLTGVRELLRREGEHTSDHKLLESRLFGTATDLLRDLLADRIPEWIESKQQVVWSLEHLLAGLSQNQPLGILVEDAHLAGAEDEKLLHELARRLRPTGTLLVVLCRSEESELASQESAAGTLLRTFAASDEVIHIQVGPLGREATRRLLCDRGGGACPIPEILRHVYAVAEGNPLFTLELFRHLVETGAIRKDQGVYRKGPAWAEASLPERLRELVALRLVGLADEDRALLDVAAVDGVGFDGESVSAVLHRGLLETLRRLQQIYRRTGLIVPHAQGYRFSNAIMREGIYRELAPALRRELHRGLARHLERVSENHPVLPARLGMHWERAGDHGRARPHLLRAAHEAATRQENLRASELLAHGGLAPEELTPAGALAHADLLLDFTGVFDALGRHEQTEAVCAALLEAAAISNDERLKLKALVRRDTSRYQRLGLKGLDEPALLRAAEGLPSSERRGRALYLLGTIAKVRGDLREAERYYRDADREFVARNRLGLHAAALDQLAAVRLRRGSYRQAEALYADAARIAAAAGRRVNAALSRISSALAALGRGALDGLASRVVEAIHTLELEGEVLKTQHARVIVGQIRYAGGDREGAERAVDEALEVLRRAHYIPGLISATRERADLSVVAGRIDEARKSLDSIRRLVELREDLRNRIGLLLIECRIACLLGDPDTARVCAGRVLDAVRSRGSGGEYAGITLDLAEAVVFGLDPSVLDLALALPPNADSGPEDDAIQPILERLCRGIRALGDPDSDPRLLQEGADALRSPLIGPHQAELRVLAAYLGALGHLRAGDRPRAVGEAGAGLDGARHLGHLWLEFLLEALLCRLEPRGSRTAGLREKLEHYAQGLSSKEERRRFLAAWLDRCSA